MLKIISKDKLNIFLFFAVILVAVFFRFYLTPERYGFDFDPTRDALISIYGATHLKLPLIGPMSGIAPFTFGPWYYYQIIFSKIILPFDYAPWIYIGITSVISVIAMYFIGKEIKGERFGLLLAFIMALSPAELGPITGLSNPNLVSMYASLSLLIFIIALKRAVPSWLYLVWGIVLGVGINDHFQMVGFLILPTLLFVYKFKSIRWKNIILFLAGIVLTFLPLLYFNLTHDWHTIRGIIYFEKIGKYAVYTPNRWLFYIRDFWPNFWSYVVGVPLFLGIITLVYSLSLAACSIYKQKPKPFYLLLFLVFLFNFVILRYFSGPRENYYFIYLHPFIVLAFGASIYYSLKNKFLFIPGIVISALFLFFVLKEDINRLHIEDRFIDFTNQTEKIVKNYPNKKFNVYHCGDKDRNRSQAIAFFLYNKGLLDENGTKIGIIGSDCSLRNLENLKFKEVKLSEDKNKLLEVSWLEITPENIYKETVEWH